MVNFVFVLKYQERSDMKEPDLITHHGMVLKTEVIKKLLRPGQHSLDLIRGNEIGQSKVAVRNSVSFLFYLLQIKHAGLTHPDRTDVCHLSVPISLVCTV